METLYFCVQINNSELFKFLFYDDRDDIYKSQYFNGVRDEGRGFCAQNKRFYHCGHYFFELVMHKDTVYFNVTDVLTVTGLRQGNSNTSFRQPLMYSQM